MENKLRAAGELEQQPATEMKTAAIVAFIFLLPPFVSANSLTLPSGWRLPNQGELFENRTPEDTGPFIQVFADFNGDGFSDQARILINERTSEIGLFVFMAKPDGSNSIEQLANPEGELWSKTLGIKVVQPGKYLTACGKGYYVCPSGQPAEISLKTPAIDFFQAEGARSYLYWEPEEQAFKRVWISD